MTPSDREKAIEQAMASPGLSRSLQSVDDECASQVSLRELQREIAAAMRNVIQAAEEQSISRFQEACECAGITRIGIVFDAGQWHATVTDSAGTPRDGYGAQMADALLAAVDALIDAREGAAMLSSKAGR